MSGICKNLVMIDDIDITFFAMHSGSKSGIVRDSMNSYKLIFRYLSKEHFFTCNKIESLREMLLRKSYHNALRKFVFDKGLLILLPYLLCRFLTMKEGP